MTKERLEAVFLRCHEPAHAAAIAPWPRFIVATTSLVATIALPCATLLAPIAVLTAPALAGRPTDAVIAAPSTGISATVSSDGRYTISVRNPSWAFGGSVGPLRGRIASSSGADRVGAYRELRFTYVSGSARIGSIRIYARRPVVLFAVTLTRSAANAAPFPALTTYPRTPYHMSYSGAFARYGFNLAGSGSPWLFFDARADAFILSPASDFMVAAMARSAGGALSSGIAGTIGRLPAGFTHRTMLVVGKGINATFATWGRAMTDLQGKVRPANDADVGLKYLGYWTDHGTAYYYHDEPALGYSGTLLAVRDEFKRIGLPLGYVQLDSWWYPKGPFADWTDSAGGAYTYTAAPALFPQGLRAFQRRLGLPLIAHARWIDSRSPYRARYRMSNNVPVDPRYWNSVMSYLKDAGVRTYEQDWLAGPASAASSIADQDAFMRDMARAAGRYGLSMQYCMPLPRHYLESTLFNNLLTMRVSDDRFESGKWTQFLYGSRLAAALGVWPWSDAFMSSERDNVLLATLSGGMVGVGDRLGAVTASYLSRAVRSDGVIVKPDAPIVPIDDVYLSDARGQHRPMVAWTYTDHGAMKAAYVFAYSRGAAAASATFRPSALGLSGRVYVYDYFGGRGTVLRAGQAFAERVRGGSYYVVVPVGPSGIAFLGDAGKYVSLGPQRIARLSDDGAVRATIAFAPTEKMVTLHGYAPVRPTVTAIQGAAGPVAYNPKSGLFRVAVAPAVGGTATLTLTALGRPAQSAH